MLRKEVARFDGMSDDAAPTNPARLTAAASVDHLRRFTLETGSALF
jgi:hypothetical protein